MGSKSPTARPPPSARTRHPTLGKVWRRAPTCVSRRGHSIVGEIRRLLPPSARRRQVLTRGVRLLLRIRRVPRMRLILRIRRVPQVRLLLWVRRAPTEEVTVVPPGETEEFWETSPGP